MLGEEGGENGRREVCSLPLLSSPLTSCFFSLPPSLLPSLFLLSLPSHSLLTPTDPNNTARGYLGTPSRYMTVTVKGQQMKLKWCPTCNIWRPPRASHCGLCNNCYGEERGEEGWMEGVRGDGGRRGQREKGGGKRGCMGVEELRKESGRKDGG